MPFDNPHEIPFGDIELLKMARCYIEDPRKWIQGRYIHGTRYCAIGALGMATCNRVWPLSHQGNRLARRLCQEMSYPRRLLSYISTAKIALISFNDSSEHKDVIAIFDKAISRLETQNSRMIEAYT